LHLELLHLISPVHHLIIALEQALVAVLGVAVFCKPFLLACCSYATTSVVVDAIANS
jgi:hypothetical protein